MVVSLMHHPSDRSAVRRVLWQKPLTCYSWLCFMFMSPSLCGPRRTLNSATGTIICRSRRCDCASDLKQKCSFCTWISEKPSSSSFYYNKHRGQIWKKKVKHFSPLIWFYMDKWAQLLHRRKPWLRMLDTANIVVQIGQKFEPHWVSEYMRKFNDRLDLLRKRQNVLKDSVRLELLTRTSLLRMIWFKSICKSPVSLWYKIQKIVSTMLCYRLC